jgi:hypothetical protein
VYPYKRKGRGDPSIVEYGTTCYAIFDKKNAMITHSFLMSSIRRFSMASAESQKPTCPVCQQTDQVKTMQAAYSTGVARCAPPDMPIRNISMMKPLVISGVMVGICVFLIVTFIGGMENNVPRILQFILAIVTLIFIISALVNSYMAFQRIVRGDDESSLLYPAWDQATARWKNLNYCSRDDIVFDPKTNTEISNNQLAKLRTVETQQTQQELQAVAQH